MKNKILPFLLAFICIPVYSQYVVSGGSGTPFLVGNEYGVPSDMQVYLLYGMSNAQISYTSSSTGNHQWYRYRNGVADAEPIQSQQTGNTSTITNVEPGYGYFTGTNPALWIIDYSQYIPVFNSLVIDDNFDEVCDNLNLNVDIDVAVMHYYKPDGSYGTIEPKYILSYSTLKWDDDIFAFDDININEVVSASKTINLGGDNETLTIPLKDTDFKLRGDLFAEYFGIAREMTTPTYSAIAIEAHIETMRIANDSTDISDLGLTEGDLGGSAPIDITFTAHANEPVAVMYNWLLYSSKESDNVENILKTEPKIKYNGKVFNYSFTEEGVYVVRLETSDRTSTCIKTAVEGDIKVTIARYKLKVPNVFTPNGDGINDIFKVSYHSLLNFKGWIFSQWGNQLFHWTNPDEGWDGKVRGKTVPTGAYYYIIEAEIKVGGKTKKIKKKGDINIINRR